MTQTAHPHDAARVPEPGDLGERDLLLGWLAFHRNALTAKCAGLSDTQLVERPAPPSTLSLLGLVRHMAEMERVYGVWANGCTSELIYVWGRYSDGGPEHDFECDAAQVATSMRAWRDEKAGTDGVSAGSTSTTRAGPTAAACGGTCRS